MDVEYTKKERSWKRLGCPQEDNEVARRQGHAFKFKVERGFSYNVFKSIIHHAYADDKRPHLRFDIIFEPSD